jgi:hypothetical protein
MERNNRSILTLKSFRAILNSIMFGSATLLVKLTGF